MRRISQLRLGLTASVLAVLAACSEPTRYRVLSFFLDGVPPPGSKTAATTGGPLAPPGGVQPAPTPAPQRLFPHTPYRENRCEGCHDADSGQLTRPVQDGLCVTCHAKLVETRFLHGPAAAKDCTICHHYHGSTFPNLLLTNVTATCQNCHDRDDLSTGDHHAALDARVCTDCHDPHGGDNRLFVKGVGP